MLPNMRQHFTSSLAWSSHPEPGLRAGFVAPFGPGSVACLGTSPTIVRDPFLSCVAWASHVFRLTSGLGERSSSPPREISLRLAALRGRRFHVRCELILATVLRLRKLTPLALVVRNLQKSISSNFRGINLVVGGHFASDGSRGGREITAQFTSISFL